MSRRDRGHISSPEEMVIPQVPDGPASGWPCPHVRADASDAVTVEMINHPQHYGGDTVYEAIKVIEAWELGFCLGNTVKYISRAGKKDDAKTLEDLKKARWYLDRQISSMEQQ